MASNDAAFREYRAAHPESVPIFQAELRLLAGAERSLLALAGWMHEQERAAHLVTYVNGCDFAQYAQFPLAVHEIAPQGGTLRRVRALRKYFHGAPVAPLLSGYQAALHGALAAMGKFHCLMHDTPALFEMGMEPNLRHRLSNAVIGRSMRRHGGRMIVTSDFLREDCRRIFGVDAAIARMGGMGDASGFRPREVVGELRLLSVSRVEANKRIDWVLEALAALRPGVDWRFDVVGKGEQLEAMRSLAASLGIAERVRFHGFVSDEELSKLYDEANLFVMPAVQGYGIPAIEALQRGIPVLLHRESGVSDVLRETPWAFVMTGGREELKPALNAAMAAVVRGEHLRAPLPELPSEASWAEHVAELCGYE